MARAQITSQNLQGLPQNPAKYVKQFINDILADLDAIDPADIGSANFLDAHKVRGIATADVADLNAFDVDGAQADGLTYVEGERIFLPNQSTGAENGIYVVGAVAGGNAPLTRATDWADTNTIKTGSLVIVDAGTANANSFFMVTNAGDVTVGTTTPTFDQYRNLLDGRQMANVADDNTALGAVGVFRATLPSGADADTDVVMDHKIRVLDAWVVMSGAGTAGGLVTLKESANAISDAVDVSAAGDTDVVRVGEIDDAQHEVAATETLRWSSASAGADFPGAEAYVLACRVA